MALVTFYPLKIRIEVPDGTTLLEASRQAGIQIESPCNGSGTCGKCKVKKVENSEYVLSCEESVFHDIDVEIPEKKNGQHLKIMDTGLDAQFSLKPFIQKKFDAVTGRTEVFAGDRHYRFEVGNTTDKMYGCVVDIGTTTLVVAMVNLVTREEVFRTSALNPQSIHAHDVLSRISLASDTGGLTLLYSLIANEIDSMIDNCISAIPACRDFIYEIIYSGNTCMLHLALNKDPASLGKYPYNNSLKGNEFVDANSVSLGLNGHARVYIPPVISAFVGADISSGIIATKLYEKSGIELLIDIGTNGEMVLVVNGKLTATSTAAGPAFEGMTITNGMRANDGAIERFSVDDSGIVATQTIGNKKAIGICGSGLIDAIGELVRTGVIQESGRLVDEHNTSIHPALLNRIEKKNGKSLFRINEDVVLTQKDIRQVQLAKAAIKTGIDFLLLASGVTPSNVDKVYIAGSFGYHLKEDSLLSTGLIPSQFKGKLDFVGNTSLSGGKTFLENSDSREKLAEEVIKVNSIDLARLAGFQDAFVKNMSFREGK